MKKNIKRGIILWMLLLLWITGCGKQQEQAVQEEEPVVEVEQKPEVLPAEEEKDEIPLHISTEKHMKTYYLEEGEITYLYLQYCDVSVEGKDYGNLKRAVENWSLEKSEELRGIYPYYEECAKLSVANHSAEFSPATVYQNVYLARADEAVVSLVEETQKDGSVFDCTYTEKIMGLNYETATGKKLGLRDLTTDWKNFLETAINWITHECQEQYGEALEEGYENRIREFFGEEKEPVWYLDASGIVLICEDLSLTTEGLDMGNVKVHLPYTALGQCIKDAYLPKNTDGVALLEENQEVQLLLGASKEPISFLIQCDWKEDVPTAYVKLGEKKKKMDTFSTLGKNYLIRKDEEIYCLVQYDCASDDYVTNVYCLSDGVLSQTDHVEASVNPGSISPWKVDMETWVYILGTYGGKMSYHFTEEGKLLTEDMEYQLVENDFVLTTTTDLPVSMEEQETILPAGSHVILTATDNESYVKFVIQESGQTGTLYLSRNEKEYYRIIVDGKDEYDCFEILPYAG